MAMTAPQKIGRGVLLLSPVVIVIAIFFASIPWLRDLNDAVILSITAGVAIFVMGYAIFLARRAEHGLDEVQRAGQLVAQKQGTTIGWAAAALVMIFPPALNGLVGLAKDLGAGSPDKAITLGIVFGFMLVVLLQTLGAFIAGAIWARRVGYR